jgi:hypothetical protein
MRSEQIVTFYLGRRDTGLAGATAMAAYALGVGKNDHILIARARILSAMVEIALCDNEGDDGERPGSHAEWARTYSEEAIYHAEQTEYKRLVSRGQTWLAISYLHESSENVDRAEALCSKVGEALKAGGGDYIYDDFKLLQKMLVRLRDDLPSSSICRSAKR